MRNEIVEEKTPLGRVLIRHNMLRRIEPVAYLRVTLGAGDGGVVRVRQATTFGRLGVIYTGDRPAVEVLEILAPIQVTKALARAKSGLGRFSRLAYRLYGYLLTPIGRWSLPGSCTGASDPLLPCTSCTRSGAPTGVGSANSSPYR